MGVIESIMQTNFLVEHFSSEIRLLWPELTDATSSWQGKTIGRDASISAKNNTSF